MKKPTKKTNDQTMLEAVFKARHDENKEFSESDFFEIFVASEVLKDQDLSMSQIRSGIAGGGNDGGIDAFYTFLNGELLEEDTKVNTKQTKNQIELFIFQSKKTASYQASAIGKFRESAEDLFTLNTSLEELSSKYNQRIRSHVAIFRNAYKDLAGSAKIKMNYFYATTGTDVHVNVSSQVKKLEKTIIELFSNAEFYFEFAGAKELYARTQNRPAKKRNLVFSEGPISTKSGSYICLVELADYCKFIEGHSGLDRSLFESNVRDYQGSVIVNSAIHKTLENQNSDDFWFLNNGVTIITPEVVVSGKEMSITDPQIVNGLQTSHEIYRHFAALRGPDLLEAEKKTKDSRTVLVRVIRVGEDAARDRIIQATNSQTTIPPSSLRGSDLIHRQIEDCLKAENYYYDRRKNFYKNAGMKISRIISIPYLAQSIMAIILLQPHNARGRPSTLLNSDEDYAKVFNANRPVGAYLKIIKIMEHVEQAMKSHGGDKSYMANIKYHIAMVYVIALARNQDPKGIEVFLESVNRPVADSDLLNSCIDFVLKIFMSAGANDKMAKSQAFTGTILASIPMLLESI